jgi:PKD repeat protein
MSSSPKRRALTIALAALGVAVLLLGAFPALRAGPAHTPSALPTHSVRLAAATGCAADRGTCAVQEATASLAGHSSGAWADLSAHVGTAPPERSYGRSMAWDPAAHYVLLFGGDEATGYQNDTWSFANGTWTQITFTNGPSGRDHGTLTWDPVDHYMLMFGGSGDGGAYNDTWYFQNGTWTQVTTSTAPSQRWSSSMVWDTVDGYALLFGGCAGAVVNDTWTYVGGHWTERFPTVAPEPVGDASLVYDPALGKVVLFGGADWYGQTYGSTWTYHNGTWSNITQPNGPPGRTMASAAYDVALGQVILLGGNGAGGVLSDQWALTGTNWVQQFPTTMPPGRTFGELSWNGGSDSLLLFSGDGNNDTWAFYALNISVSATPTNGTAPLPVQLSANVTGAQGAVTFVWQLGNGSFENGSQVNATYSQAGVYYPTVQVTDGFGAYGTQSVRLDIASPLNVNAFASPTLGPAPLNVVFGSAIAGGISPYAILWEVDGSPVGSASNGSHVFSFSGTHTLSLVVHDSGGNWANRTFAITVTHTVPPPLSVVVTGGPTVGEAPFNATFSVSTSGGYGPYSPIWSFGDGGQQAGFLVTHTFVSVGSYAVSVQVTDGAADSASGILNVTAMPALTTAVSASALNGTAPLAVTLTSTPLGGTGSSVVRWDFGDGTSASGLVAHTTYSKAGSYSATAVVTDSLGGYASASVTIVVAAAPHGHTVQNNTNGSAATPAASGITPPEAGAIGAGVVGAIAVIAGLVLWRRRPGT